MECTNCGRYFPGDEERCPYCKQKQVKAALSPPSKPSKVTPHENKWLVMWILFFVYGVLVVIAGYIAGGAELSIACLPFPLLCAWRIKVHFDRANTPEFQTLVSEHETKTKEKKQQLKANKERLLAEKKEREWNEMLFKEKDNRPVSTILLSTQSDTITRKQGALGRALVGDMLAGPTGALIGAATASSKTTVANQRATFRVEYATGRIGVETVKVGSDRYFLLVEKMK